MTMIAAALVHSSRAARRTVSWISVSGSAYAT